MLAALTQGGGAGIYGDFLFGAASRFGSGTISANREISLFGNLISMAIDRGDASSNPCRGDQAKHNTENPPAVLPGRLG